MLKTLCMFIAATVPAEEGGTSKLLEAAKKIGEEPSGAERSIEKPASRNPTPANGSYERLMKALAGANR